jgi:hypothetical protein
VQFPELPDRLDTGEDRFVMKAGGLREQRHGELLRAGGAGGEQTGE